MNEEELHISMILFEELGLSEKSESNPLEDLYSKLEHSVKRERASFNGINNYLLDIAKVNRFLFLSIPNLGDGYIEIYKNIVEIISKDLSNNIIFEILAREYREYKNNLNFINELMELKQFDSKNKESNKPRDIMNKQFSEI